MSRSARRASRCSMTGVDGAIHMGASFTRPRLPSPISSLRPPTLPVRRTRASPSSSSAAPSAMSRPRTARVPRRCGGHVSSTFSASPTLRAMDLETYCDRLAKLAVEIGANVQNDQIVAVTYSPGMEPLAHAVARKAYERGARFVDPFVFDGDIKRIRLEAAREDTLEFVPDWW